MAKLYQTHFTTLHRSHIQRGIMTLGPSTYLPEPSRNNINEWWPGFWPLLVYSVRSWLRYHHAMACLWLRYGKQEQTAQEPSFHVVCGPDERPDSKTSVVPIWRTPVLLSGNSPICILLICKNEIIMIKIYNQSYYEHLEK